MDLDEKTEIVTTPKYQSFESLPSWAQNAIVKFCNDNGTDWVFRKIPALDGKTFLEVINSEGGEEKVKNYFRTLIGKFFPEETLET